MLAAMAHIRIPESTPRRGRGIGAAAALMLAAALTLQPARADAQQAFPGVKNAPDPGSLSYGGYFKAHQPVKIVFGVSDPVPTSLKESLHNAALSIQYLQRKHYRWRIEVVLYGNAVKAADPMRQEYANLGPLMRSLHAAGVEFAVCFNSMAEVGMTKDDVYSYMTLVPAGILELARRQNQGWAYIRNF